MYDKLFDEYMKRLKDPHSNISNIGCVNSIDFFLRTCIGKTNDLGVGLCSHQKILEREFPNEPNRCRQCGRRLVVGVGRWNDYLVLRHPDCKRPICMECGEENPDCFHIAFKKGLKKYKVIKKSISEAK